MLLSRVAETVYWIGRYVERAENTARLIMVNANIMLDLPKGVALGWEPVLHITGITDLFYEHYDQPSERNVVKFLISDRRNPSSIISSVEAAREDLRTTRVIMPREAWEVLNDFYLYTRENLNKGIAQRSRNEYLTDIVENCQKFTGLLSGTMSHDDPYTFILMGRNLERADMTTRVMDVRAGNVFSGSERDLAPYEDIQWRSVLNSLAAYSMYRRHVHMRVSGSNVIRFLLKDEDFPRSVYHCLGEVVSSLQRFERNEAALRDLGQARRMVTQVEADNLVGESLNAFVDELQIAMGHIHELLESTYFRLSGELQTEDEGPHSSKDTSTVGTSD